MFNWRLYRVAFVPFVFALAIAAFSLTAPPLPLTSTLAPDAFDGAHALAEAKSLAADFPAAARAEPATKRAPAAYVPCWKGSVARRAAASRSTPAASRPRRWTASAR